MRGSVVSTACTAETNVTEDQVIGHLLGPSGGTFALGILVGSLLMWYANLKIVNPYVTRAHVAEIAAMQARIDAMEYRIKELETFESRYMALVEAHSNSTLHPSREKARD